jgi:myxalamid-type polyketide synthase MxaE and MxaD
VAIKPDASYLITGGLGGLGPHIAEWLIQQGARQIILTGRRKLPERGAWDNLSPSHEDHARVTALRELEKTGATISYEPVDVANRVQMAAFFARVDGMRTPLRGIIHAAADINFCAVREMTPEGLHATMRAKVDGTWLLHEFSRHLPLDLFVLFSSAAGLFGVSRFSHYAAGNVFLDAIASWRRSLGLPALSVNWGTWEQIRWAAGDDVFQRFGWKSMPTEPALAAMSRLAAQGCAQQTVADIDWPVLKQAFEARSKRRFFDRLEIKAALASTASASAIGWKERLSGTRPEERRDVLSDLIASEVRRVLGLEADDPVRFDRGMFDMGMDSLMSVQLRSRLEPAAGSPLPTTLTFTYPTIQALAGYFLEQVFQLPTSEVAPSPATTKPTEAATSEVTLAGLSDDEVKRLLSDELSALTGDLRD